MMELVDLPGQHRGHIFKNLTIGGTNNRVHLGDHINHGYPAENPANRARDLLFLTDHRDDRAGLLTAKGAILEGTCEWILEQEKFRRWARRPPVDDDDALPGLWISGGPGKGKTMLAIYISEILENHFAAFPDQSLLYFFCAHNDNKRNTPVTILRSWVRQLLGDEPGLINHVLSDFQGPVIENHTVTNLDTLWRVFSTLVARSSRNGIFCVLDGLDECEIQLDHFVAQVLACFQCDVPGVSEKLRLLIFSRETQLCNFRERDGFGRINLDLDADAQVKHAISLFVENTIMEFAMEINCTLEWLIEIWRKILQRPLGDTFIWIGYAANELRRCQSEVQVEEVLRSIPLDLDEVYERMIEQIYQGDQKQCCRRDKPAGEVTRATQLLLQWVVVARRPLFLKEVAVILGITPTDEGHDEEIAKERIKDYGHLFQINGGKVELLHKSAGDYLSRGAPYSQNHLEQYRVDTENAHYAIARFCLELLRVNFNTHSSIGSKDAQPLAILKTVPLMEYAVLYWPEHFRQAGGVPRTGDSATESLLNTSPIITEEKLRSRWWKCYWEITPHDRNAPTSFSLLHLAAYFGLYEIAKHELSVKRLSHIFSRPINRQDGHRRTPLSWAAEHGHLEIAQLLLDNNADTDIPEIGGGRALNRSFNCGSPAMVKLLIDSGAKSDYRFKLPFPQPRTGEEWKELDQPETRLLWLLTGNSITGFCLRNLVILASSMYVFHLALIGTLLALAFVVRRQYRYVFLALVLGIAILILICAIMHDRIICYISGASFGKVRKTWLKYKWFTPISRSIYECSPEITDIFLVGMADANSKLSDGRSILSHAAEAGNLELVTQILDQGGHADEPESEDKDLIQSIVEWCIARLARKPDSQPLTKLRATRLLAKFGKECNECDFGNKSTPLIRASQCRRETRLQIMSLLLSKGANPSSTDVWGETPLHRAVQTGHEDATHLLLRQDNAYVDAQNSRQATPLLEAAVRGHIQLVKILVQHGADVLHTISGGMTSLMLAAAVGELEVVSYLMEQGVPINASNDWGNTALLVAAGCGRTEVLAFLLQNGAAVDVKNKKGRCPVLAAAAEGYEECVDLLLSYGAKPARTNGFICVKAVVINMLCLDWRCVKLLLRRSHRVPNP